MLEDNYKSKQDEQKIIQRKKIDDIQQLARNIRSACEKNRVTYKKIVKDNPLFNLQLYNPPIHLNIKKDQINMTKQILIKQIDRLLDQESKLQKELNKIQFRKQQQKFSQQCQLNQQANHFMFLRTVWKRPICAIDSEDRIQKLNKSVALIKGHIISETKKQRSLYNNTIDINKYQKLKEQNERLMMEKEDLLRIQKNYNNSADTLNRIRQLQNQNDFLKNQLKQYKEKLLLSEKENLKNKIKVNQLQESTLQKSRESSKNLPKIVYFNQNYQIQIHSKLIQQSHKSPIQMDLNAIISLFENQNKNWNQNQNQNKNNNSNNNHNHNYYSNSNKNYSPKINQQQQQLSPTLQKYEQQQSSTTQRSKRLKSIGDKNNVENQLKKTRFIRTRKLDQIQTTKDLIEQHLNGIALPNKLKISSIL